MKRLRIVAASLPFYILTLLSPSCVKTEKRPADTDTVAEILEDSVTPPPSYVLSNRGIGPLEVGMNVESWPEESEGLYHYVEADKGGEANQFNFYADEQPSITVLDFGEGKADLLIVDDPQIGAQVGDTVVNMTTPFAEFLQLPDVSASWEQLDDEGMWYWKCNGLWFAPALENLPEKLANKLYNPEKAPIADDFPREVTIGYIATGLPF